MNFLFLSVLVVFALPDPSTQVVVTKACPQVTLKSSFNLTRYLGDWYENRRFYAAFQINNKCVHANYKLKDDGKIRVLNAGLNSKNGDPISIEGEAYVPNPETEPASLRVRFSSFQPWGNYWVLATDYESYSLVYSCRQPVPFIPISIQYAWILTRAVKPDQSVIDRGLEIFKQNGVDTSLFQITDQDSCGR